MTFIFSFCLMLGFPSGAYSESATQSFNVNANVGFGIDLTVDMRRNNTAGPVVNAINFGDLVNIGTGTLRSSPTSTTQTGAVVCLISANTHGIPFKVTQTGTALNNMTGSALPDGACVVKPVYAKEDNGNQDMPAGAKLGTATSWVGTKTLYESEPASAQMRTIQAYYSITDDTTQGATDSVSLSQGSGDYKGQITITATTV